MTVRSSSLALPVLVAALVAAVGPVFGSEFDTGKALYEEKCMICHGMNGKGDGPAAAALSPPPMDFNRSEFWKQPDLNQTITKTVQSGKGVMPAFNLTGDEIKALIDFMSQSFRK